MDVIGTIIGTIGILGLLIIMGIGAFRIGFVLGLIYIFVIMIIVGGTMAEWDDKPWYY